MPFDPNPYLMDLKGKQYLQVAHRLLWLNEDYKEGLVGRFQITTDLVSHREWQDERLKRLIKEAVFKAVVVIRDETGEVLKEVTGYGSETNIDFGDYIEKAETKAIGRALALAGYGTQHAPELEEPMERSSPFLDKDGNRGPKEFAPVDSPVTRPKLQKPPVRSKRSEPAPVKEEPLANDPMISINEGVEGVEGVRADSADMSKEEILEWLKQNAENRQVKEMLAQAARSSDGTTRKISSLPEETLRSLYVRAASIVASS